MKLIQLRCPQCGGNLEVFDNVKQAHCPFCNSDVLIDDEVNHIQFDNSAAAGYEFEMGRIKAQREVARQQAEYEHERILAQQEYDRKQKNLKWWILGWIFVFPIPLTILLVKTKKLNPIVKAILIAVLWVAVIIFGAVNAKNKPNDPDQLTQDTIWTDTYNTIEDFDYYIDGDSIVLTDYHSSNKKVNIASTYKIDGRKLKVTSLDGTFALDSVSSAIVPEGVTGMSDNVFNSCGIKYLYLPSTLKDFNGWNYFHDGEKLYYGGSEKQFKQLFKGDRKDIDFKEIIYDADPDKIIKENKD